MKILVVMKNWLGDILFQLPALEMIAVEYPQAEIVCLAPSRCREILEQHPAVRRVIVLDEKKEHRSFFARAGFLLKLRREKWDRVYLFHRSRTRALLAFLSGAKERIGYGARRRWLLTKAVAEPRMALHQIDYFIELLVRAGFKRPEEKPAYRFYLSDESRQAAENVLKECDLIHEDVLRPFAAFHLGANWEPKRWPITHFARLADLLHEKWDLPVILTGGPDDVGLGAGVKASVRSAKIISLIGRTTLGTLGAVFERATFVVSGDSGPMHMASGVGAPVTALFGPTNPQFTGPRGTGDKIVLSYVPPGYKTPWYGDLPREGWISSITPEEVAAAIEKKKWVLPRFDSAATARFENAPSETTGLSPEDATVKNVLLVTLSNIGDVIMTTPAISRVRAEFPDAHLTVVVGPRAHGVLAGSRQIDQLLVYDKHAPLAEQIRFIFELRKRSYDWVIDLRNTAIPFLVRSRRRSPLLRRLRSRSMRERHLEVLQKMGLPPAFFPPFDFFRETNETGILRKLRRHGVRAERDWILMAPAAASELKTWRLEGFKEVLERLLAERSEEIILVGDERERKIVEPLVMVQPSRIHNLAGETTLPELAALVAHSALLVTNDSAVMHLGFELNRPVVAIFGPTHHEKYGRTGPQFRIVREPIPCSPCESPRCRFARQACFEDLSAEKVLTACRELLCERPVHESLSS